MGCGREEPLSGETGREAQFHSSRKDLLKGSDTEGCKVGDREEGRALQAEGKVWAKVQRQETEGCFWETAKSPVWFMGSAGRGLVRDNEKGLER